MTLSSWIHGLIRRLQGERRHRSRPNVEHVNVVNRQYAAAVRLGRKVGRTPEELLDYRRADHLWARKR